MLPCNKTAHPCHFCVCVYAPLKCRFWGWLPCGSIFTPVFWRTLARSAIYCKMLVMTDEENVFHCENFSLFPSTSPTPSLRYCPQVFLPLLLLPGWSFLEVCYCLVCPDPHSLWGVCWSRSDILVSHTPARVWSNIGPYFSALSLAPGRTSGPFSNKAPSCSYSFLASFLPGSLSLPHLSLRSCFALNTANPPRNISRLWVRNIISPVFISETN